MQYEIVGGNMPAVVLHLERGETIRTEAGGMAWSTPNMEMETVGGGLKKMFGRSLAGEAAFTNIYTAQGSPGMIGIASSFPGSIAALELRPGQELMAQRGAFLASDTNVELSVGINPSISGGFFGGEGFIMQKISAGNRGGLCFLEIDGSAVKYHLKSGEKMYCDSGRVAYMDASCSLTVHRVRGAKNIFFGGEGLLLACVEGPGEVCLQTMPVSHLANVLRPFFPSSTN